MTTLTNSPVSSAQPQTKIDKIRVLDDCVNQSTEKSAPPLITVYSHVLLVVDGYTQGISSECQSLAMVLSTIKTDDSISKAVITVVRKALLINSTEATKLHADIQEHLSSLPKLEVSSYAS